jgi:ribosome-associated translation inhibitor RaiA
MILLVQITFRNMPPSDAVAARVQEEAEKLDEFYKRITSCRVIVEVPHRHHMLGDQVHVRIELGVLGGEIVVRHEASLHSALQSSGEEEWEKHLEANPEHKAIGVAIRDALKRRDGGCRFLHKFVYTASVRHRTIPTAKYSALMDADVPASYGQRDPARALLGRPDRAS